MPVTDEDLDHLLELSDVDAGIARIGAVLADLPEQQAVDATAARRTEVEREGDGLRAELEEVAARQRHRERDIEQLRARLAAEQQRLYGGGITNAREMQSIEAEIEGTTRRIDEAETHLLEAMEQAEELEQGIEDRARGVEQLGAEVGALEQARDVAAQALLADRAELEVRRDELRAALSAEPTARYDAVRERFPAGAAVGELSGSACTSCRIDLARVRVNELRDGPPLATCPNCRRLLVVR